MPRPKNDPASEKTVRLNVRLSEAEAATFNDKVEAAGVNASALLRTLIADAPMPSRARRRPVQDADELAELLRAVGRMGGNINQLAKIANAGSWPGAAEIAEARSDILWMRNTLMNALGYSGEE